MKSIQVSDEMHARLKGLHAKNMDAAIVSMQGAPVLEDNHVDLDAGVAAELKDIMLRYEARLKNIQDKSAAIESLLIEVVAKVKL